MVSERYFDLPVDDRFHAINRAIWRVLIGQAQSAIEKGDSDTGNKLYGKALVYAQGDKGPEDADLAASLRPLADFCWSIRRYAQAEWLYRRILSIYNKIFGPEDIEVAIGLHNLARLYEDQGRADDALKLRKRAAEILQSLQ